MNGFMKLLTIVSILLMGVSLAHLLRLIFQVDIIVGGFMVPLWVSIPGFIIVAGAGPTAVAGWQEGI